MLNVDGEALKGDLKALYKGQFGGVKCAERAVQDYREEINGNEE